MIERYGCRIPGLLEMAADCNIGLQDCMIERYGVGFQDMVAGFLD
jgi:hypothetical protein